MVLQTREAPKLVGLLALLALLTFLCGFWYGQQWVGPQYVPVPVCPSELAPLPPIKERKYAV